MYVALALVFLLAVLITLAKVRVEEALTPTPDPAAPTFTPVKQRTASKIMYTGDGFLPEDWYFFHSKVTLDSIYFQSIQPNMSILIIKRISSEVSTCDRAS